MQDLSHIYDNPDLEQAQEHHDAMPDELHDHIMKAFAHKAGLGPHPGKYKGPPAPVPTDWDPSPEDRYEESQKTEQDAIQNISQGSPPTVPATASRMPVIP